MGYMRASRKILSEPLTEQVIQQRLNHFFASWRYNVDGLYVFGWESDKLIWTKNGYVYEFEIKLTRADFRNDFKNKARKHILLASVLDHPTVQQELFDHYCKERRAKYPGITPDDCLREIAGFSERERRIPNYFYYAVPEGLLEPDDVPEYAGLIWILKEYSYVRQSFVIKKQAPVLHKQKYTDGELNLAEKFWWNWQGDRQQRLQMQKERDDARKALETELSNRHQEETYESLKWKYDVTSKERNEYQSLYYNLCRDQNIDRMIIRKLRHELKQLNPEFDYDALERQCEKCLGYDKGKI